MSEIKLSEIEPGQELARVVISRIRADFDWRAEHLGGFGSISRLRGDRLSGAEALDRAAELFEAWTSDNPESNDIPRVNLIHRAVEDFLSVAITNIPKAKLRAEKFMGVGVEEWEKPLRLEIINQTETVMNAYVKSILNRNNYQDLIRRAVTHAAIFGVGYIYTEVDDSLDLRHSYLLRDLLNKEEDLTEEELETIRMLSKRISLKVIDPRDVLWRHSVRDAYDEEMTRVTIVERFDTMGLREMWSNSEFLEDPDLIKPGNIFHFLDSDAHRFFQTVPERDTTTPQITVYELEPIAMERVVTAEDGTEATFEYTDWMMHKIVIAGDQLVDYQRWTSGEGPLRLPVVPIYLRKSVNHPYGWSLPLALEKSEEYINAIQTMIFKSARKAVSTQGVIVALPNLGETDLEEIEHVLEEGGVARITGNKIQGPIDIRDAVMPLSFNASPINPVLLQAVNLQMQMFSLQSQEVDAGAVGSARSGSAKRTQIALADRPKTISINTMADGIEHIYDNIFELVRTYHKGQIVVTVDVPGGGREQVTLNEVYRRNILVMDRQFETDDNPLGLRIMPFEATLNSTTIQMYAVADDRSELPLDMVSKFQLGIALVQSGLILPETFREFALNDEMKSFDDAVRNRKRQDELEAGLRTARQAQAQQAALEQAPVLPADSSLSITAQDVVQDQIDSVQGSPIATPSNPFVLA